MALILSNIADGFPCKINFLDIFLVRQKLLLPLQAQSNNFFRLKYYASI